jgi:hypothetical protein
VHIVHHEDEGGGRSKRLGQRLEKPQALPVFELGFGHGHVGRAAMTSGRIRAMSVNIAASSFISTGRSALLFNPAAIGAYASCPSPA